MTRGFTVHGHAFGPAHRDVRCTVGGCPWHLVVRLPADPRVYGDLSEHLEQHRQRPELRVVV